MTYDPWRACDARPRRTPASSSDRPGADAPLPESVVAMNLHRTRTLRRLVRIEPQRIIWPLDPASGGRRRHVWAVALPTDDSEHVQICTGDTRNETLRAAYEAMKESA